MLFKNILSFFVCVACLTLLPSHFVLAQDADLLLPSDQAAQIVDEIQQSQETAPPPSFASMTREPLVAEMMLRAYEVEGLRVPVNTPSLFFTVREQALIEEARRGVTARLATDRELDAAQDGDSIVKGPREVSIGGILYAGANDWVIWLNGEKITPQSLPSEITDITVNKDSVKLKWFDAYTNQIFPIKLKTHQRFNLDSRIFITG